MCMHTRRYIQSNIPWPTPKYVICMHVCTQFIHYHNTPFCYTQAVLESQLADDPLDNDEQLQDQMDSLPYLCRFQVKWNRGKWVVSQVKETEGIGRVSGERNRVKWGVSQVKKNRGTFRSCQVKRTEELSRIEVEQTDENYTVWVVSLLSHWCAPNNPILDPCMSESWEYTYFIIHSFWT